MSQPARKRELDPALLPDSTDVDGVSAADEQFAHGVLEHVRLDDAEAQRSRTRSVMAVIRREAGAASAGDEVVTGVGRVRSSRRLLLRRSMVPLAAAASILIAVVLLVGPGQPSAQALVASSIAASADAGDRSYDVIGVMPHGPGAEGRTIGRIDVRGRESLLVEAFMPGGDRLIMGRTGQGAPWMIERDGSIDRFANERRWPRWIEFGEQTYMFDSIESVLDELPGRYTLRRDGRERLEGSSATLVRVTATNNGFRLSEPHVVELFIDPSSRLVHRMELHWRHGNGGEGRGRGRGGRGPGLREGGPGGSGVGRPGGGRGGGLREGGRSGERSGRGRPGVRGGGPGGPGGPEGVPRRHPRPRHEAPGFDQERPPPKAIIFQLRSGASFDGAWFAPESHVDRR